MAKQKDFDVFLSSIEPSTSTVEYISSVQNNLRDYLKNHPKYKDIHLNTFLSGSYAKDTCIRPKKYDGKRDVDIVVVTNYTLSESSSDVLQELLEILLEKELYNSARLQSHSIGIELNGIEIDVIPVIKCNDSEMFYIGSSDENIWELTDPKGHIKWSTEVNVDNNSKYKPLVKMMKWWRRTNCSDGIKYPKGLALEKIIADNLPDDNLSTENYLINTMQKIVESYKEEYVDKGKIPFIEDPCIIKNNLLENYTLTEFKAFISNISDHLDLLSKDGTCNNIWQLILGDDFPVSSSAKSLSTISSVNNAALNASHRQKPLWSIPKNEAVIINAKLIYPNGIEMLLENDGDEIPKNCTIIYRALHGIKQPYDLKWQVVNTGYEASYNSCLRGGFEDSNLNMNCRKESSAYAGKHYVQCYVIKNGQCVAKSKEFIINIE
ncbi:MAG: hypothetical protein RR738_04365 [Anaerorhabdus sp.]|uniref:SMODS domain-containing nucleotidyltransferase n=1 Tax=Anaerorhabdus sp. TaxID=1872524 RepID=UPI002B213105|nr:hypothetical protein [Anaerorhabdus sp.]MEA4874288.1 hypothetical protein [Anaerorhabdus sp.]